MLKHRILIVDDQVDVRRMIRAGLESLGPEYIVADIPSAEEALLEISRNPIDLLILDIRLPGMSGLELLSKLKKQKPATKVILITGMTDARTQELFRAADVVGRFNKPVHMDELLETVQKNLVSSSSTPFLTGEGEETRARLSALDAAISELHHELNASDVILVDNLGNITLRTGNLPDSLLGSFIPALISSVNESRRVFHLLGSGSTQHMQLYEGADYYLISSHVRETHFLMAFLPNYQGEDSYQAIRSAIHHFVEDLGSYSLEIPAVASPKEEVLTSPVPGEQEEQEEGKTETVETIFPQEEQSQLGKDELDDYWTKAIAESDPNATSNTTALSFDQARKLGLTPNEDST